jgi:hypothetical protein
MSSISSRSPIATEYLTAQQALTCYSYMLLLLDRVVGVLTDQTSSTTAATAGAGDLSSSSPSTVRLGVFSLASQPALNAEVVMHMVLRMVLRLRGLIQGLVAGFELAAGAGGVGDGAPNMTASGDTTSGNSTVGLFSSGSPATTLIEGGVAVSSTPPSQRPSVSWPSDSSIAGSLRVVADLVSEREKVLLERLG